MNVEPVICACGNPTSGRDDAASVLFGPMCDACIRIAYHQASWLCNRCIQRLNTEYPEVRFALSNQHELAHSHVLDTCVDRAILPFLEGFNQNVAPTFSSCQGVDMLPGRPGRWAQEPFIVARGQHQPAVTAWAHRGPLPDLGGPRVQRRQSGGFRRHPHDLAGLTAEPFDTDAHQPGQGCVTSH